MKSLLKPEVSPRMREAIERLAEERITAETAKIIRRDHKLIAVSLNRKFGFGAGRISRMMGEITRLAEVSDTDEEFWTHIDMRLKQIGLDFEEEEE